MTGLSVIGSGYVGLVWACCMADRGHQVVISERDRGKLRLLNEGKLPFYEPCLEGLMSRALAKARLSFTSETCEAITNSEISFIAVGTPSIRLGGMNLSQIKSASVDVGRALRETKFYHVVVVRSSVTPGTTTNLVKPTLERASGKRVGRDFGLAVQPEFLREGSAIRDVLNPDRIVIGACDKRAGNRLRIFYRAFYSRKVPPLLEVSPVSYTHLTLPTNREV